MIPPPEIIPEPDISFCLADGADAVALGRWLAALAEEAGPVDYETIVVGDHLSETDNRALKQDFPEIVFYQTPLTTWGANINHALRIAKGRYLAPWSATVYPLAGCLPTLVEFLDEATETGLAAPRLVDEAGVTLASARRQPGLLTLLALHSGPWNNSPDPAANEAPPRPPTVAALIASLAAPLFRRHFYADQPLLAEFEAEYLSGRALLIRREALEEVGFLDQGFATLYADADYCRRLARHGWHLHYLAGALARDLLPDQHRPDYLARHPPPRRGGDITRYLLKKWLNIS